MAICAARCNRVFARIFALVVGALIAASLAPRSGAAAYREEVLYRFCPQTGCTDGSDPQAGLIMDKAGNLYGTTNALISSFCSPGCGTVFELTPNAAKTKWTETVLYRFCLQAGCTDGSAPVAGLIMDKAGNLYGTTSAGGDSSGCSTGCGTVFELTPNAAKTKWTETVLYSFCPQAGCIDGAVPVASLIMDASGNLYGTTEAGGSSPCPFGGCGTVFELTPNAAKWAEKVLYNFCAQPGCADGSGPVAGLIMHAGHLYGTTVEGGANCQTNDRPGCGTVFELTHNTAKAKWTEAVLHSFCAQTDCIDGAFPEAGLIMMDPSGKLYGTTEGGTVFALTPGPAKTAWTETVLYSFCAQTACADGSEPVAGLIMGTAGNLYGTTRQGGHTAGCCGTVFELTPNAAKTKWTQKVLYDFGSQPDGDGPVAGLIRDTAGNLYGTTVAGGAKCQLFSLGCGTVFELKR
jgi:uncharacterized repeat protein (TIGR03803 family)